MTVQSSSELKRFEKIPRSSAPNETHQIDAKKLEFSRQLFKTTLYMKDVEKILDHRERVNFVIYNLRRRIEINHFHEITAVSIREVKDARRIWNDTSTFATL